MQIVVFNDYFKLNLYNLKLSNNRELFLIESLKISVALENLEEYVIIYLN